MSKVQKRIVLLDVLLMSIIPLLFLYNQNRKFLYFPQIAIACAIFACITVAIFFLFFLAFHSYTGSFLACLVFVALVFYVSNIYAGLTQLMERLIYLLPISSAYIIGYVYYRIFRKKELNALPFLASVVFTLLLLFNVIPIIDKSGDIELSESINYKTDFVVDESTSTPNVYWILCDGLLGFEAMENYFNDSQEELISTLTALGFEINKSAMLESGHKTRVAVPALMCPDFYDKYLVDFLSNHETAMDLRESNDKVLSEARFHNEFITAFDESGYTTITMSLDEDVFFPTTDYYYYLAAHYTSNAEYEKLPYYVEKPDISDINYFENRIYASQLGDLFLGDIPSLIFNICFSDEQQKHPLTTSFNGASDILLNSELGNKYSVLLSSTNDALYSEEISEPKLVIIHDFMAHFPFVFDENGNRNDEYRSKESYLGHHTYATKVLVGMIDMILDADPDAVIVLQSDHGLHGYTAEDIVNIFGTNDASLEIWNNVFSCVRVPEKFKNGEEKYMMATPLNISRYLVNNFVGKNYPYIEMGSE